MSKTKNNEDDRKMSVRMYLKDIKEIPDGIKQMFYDLLDSSNARTASEWKQLIKNNMERRVK